MLHPEHIRNMCLGWLQSNDIDAPLDRSVYMAILEFAMDRMDYGDVRGSSFAIHDVTERLMSQHYEFYDFVPWRDRYEESYGERPE